MVEQSMYTIIVKQPHGLPLHLPRILNKNYNKKIINYHISRHIR